MVTAVCVLFAVPPDIIDEESSSDTLATEGMPVALVCKARGNPRTQIAWRREDGKPIRLCQPERPIDRPRKRQHHSRDRECREGKYTVCEICILKKVKWEVRYIWPLSHQKKWFFSALLCIHHSTTYHRRRILLSKKSLIFGEIQGHIYGTSYFFYFNIFIEKVTFMTEIYILFSDGTLWFGISSTSCESSWFWRIFLPRQ